MLQFEKTYKILLFCTLAFAPLGYSFLDEGAMCSGVKHCLNSEIPGCTDQQKKKNPAIKYNKDFCAPFKELVGRGVPIVSPIPLQMWSYLGREYRVTYNIEGTLPINADMMGFLLDNKPFTAQLINAYQKSTYTIAYTNENRRAFIGNNGRNLAGRFNWVRWDQRNQRNIFFGYGTAKVLMWRLHGVAVVFLDYSPIDSSSIKYTLRSIVFPGNAMLNSIMQMDTFRNVVHSKMLEIVEHVESSANQFAKGDRTPIATSKVFASGPMHKNITTFDAIISGSGWTPKKDAPVRPPKKKRIK